MDALRIERLCWSLLLGGFLATLAAGLLVPDPTGALWVGSALLACVVAVPLSYRFLVRTESSDATAGDLTVRWVTLLVVAVSLRTLLDAVGVEGVVNAVVSFGAAYLAANRSRRWNPARLRGGDPA